MEKDKVKQANVLGLIKLIEEDKYTEQQIEASTELEKI